MAEEKKNTVSEEQANNAQEINLDELDKVTGGSIGNVRYTKTSDISSDTRSKI